MAKNEPNKPDEVKTALAQEATAEEKTRLLPCRRLVAKLLPRKRLPKKQRRFPMRTKPPRIKPSPGEQEQIVYLNLSELFAFKDHPFQVRNDEEMKFLLLSRIKRRF